MRQRDRANTAFLDLRYQSPQSGRAVSRSRCCSSSRIILFHWPTAAGYLASVAGNHFRSASRNSAKAGSVQPWRPTRSPSCLYIADDLGFLIARRASSRAAFGSVGFAWPSDHRPRSASQDRRCSPPAGHPMHRSTCGEAAKTHTSSSGSRTIASARSPQPETARRPRIRSESSPWEWLSCPLPTRSNTTRAYRYSLSKGRRKSCDSCTHPGSRRGWTNVSVLARMGRIPSAAGRLSRPRILWSMFLSAASTTRSFDMRQPIYPKTPLAKSVPRSVSPFHCRRRGCSEPRTMSVAPSGVLAKQRTCSGLATLSTTGECVASRT